MSSAEAMDFDELPRLGGLYVRAAMRRRKPPRRSTELPDLSARTEAVVVDDLSDYRRVCGIADDEKLPPTFPQVLATPLHAAIVAHRDFPLPAMGMVHLENEITQHRPIDEGEAFDLRCQVAAQKWDRHLGLKFAIDTVAESGGEEIWSSRLWALSRGAKDELEKREKRKRPTPPVGEVPESLVSLIVDAPADLGRRYAAVCGDYNPIHLHPLTSKPFGFRRPIVHGMWTLARCWAELANFAEGSGFSLSVRFKQPLYLPSRALITVVEDDKGLTYRARSVDGKRLFLEGALR